MNQIQKFYSNARNKLYGFAGLGAAALALAPGMALAQAILADVVTEVETARTLGVQIVIAVTLMIFVFVVAKWVRRAK
jgi:D-arabinose 1-dehydrogenase-like Zn-dependent alcohol dehydrogenase